MDIENISSKSDIHNYLESNIEAYKEEIKNIIKQKIPSSHLGFFAI